MIDVAQAIDAEQEALNLKPVNAASGAYNSAGKWVPGAVATVPIRAAVQPMNGRILADLPEGVREKAKHLIWTRSTIKIGDVVPGYMGGNWRISFVWPRPLDGFNRGAMEELIT